MTPHDAWKTTAPFESAPDYDYSNYSDLPYVFDKKMGRYRDSETKELVKTDMAIRANDEECEKQDELEVEIQDMYDREVY